MSKEKQPKSFDNRIEDEKSEGYQTNKSDLPKARFQDEKQVLSPDEMSVSKQNLSGADGTQNALKPETMAAKSIKSKISIRPDAGVEELENKQVGGVPLAGAMSVRGVAGVSNLSPADDESKIPYSGGNYRPDSRFGKKRSEDLFLLDNQISEQIAPYVDDALDLREAPDAKQGYNGRKQFKQARGKKNYEYVNGSGNKVPRLPQQLLNETSVDFTHTSKLVYTSGQMITGTSNAENVTIKKGSNYPAIDNKAIDDSLGGGQSVTTSLFMNKSNYKPNMLTFKMQNGKITAISISEDQYEIHANPLARDQANFNLQVDTHNVAKTLVRLQNDLGRETTDKWSPLGYVIDQPYEYNMLMHDIEASTGAIMAIAYRAAVSSLAWQRNIAGKDGINPQRNAVKMILEGYAGTLESNDSNVIQSTVFDHVIWRESEYRKGSVAALIRMFDSVGKYKTKADFLGLQRSLTLHLSSCDNNLNPLHCKPQFIKTLNKAHMFSTVDGNYNPLLPVFSTKRMKVVNPLSLNIFLQNWKNPATLTAAERMDARRDVETGTYSYYMYSYSDLRSKYETRVQHPIIEGLLRWMLNHEGALCSTYGGDGNTEVTANIPFEFNFEAPSMLEFMLCSAAQDVLWERNVTFRDIIFAGDQSEYIWPDLVGLDKLNPLYSSQLQIRGYKESLKLGKLALDTALREFWSDQMQLTKKTSSKAQYMLPWHFNEVSFGNAAGGGYTQNEGFFVEEKAYNMSIPSIKQGVRHDYVDIIKSMSERDIRLALDRRVDIPVFDSVVSENQLLHGTSIPAWTKYSNYNASGVLDSNIKLSTLRYDANSDGRLIATYDLATGSNRRLTHHALYLCPKELGFIDDLYDDEAVITSVTADRDAVTITATTISADTDLGSSTKPAYNGYSPLVLTSYRVYDSSSSNGSIDRSAALQQVFYRCFASIDANIAAINNKYIEKIGIIPCLGYNNGAALDVKGVYNLGSNVEDTSYSLDNTIRTFAHRIWTQLQRFFLPVNRFENIFSVNENVDFDPLEGTIYFGFCGMLASDFTQDILERLDAYDQLGIDYIEDTFCKDSLLFRLD